MPIPSMSDADLGAYLADLGVRAGHHVLVHSRLFSLGRLDNGAASVWGALLDVVGPTGTIAVPAYTLYLPEGEVFDPAVTPPQRMGSLSTYVWENVPDKKRSPCPLHSHLCVGAKADLMDQVDGLDSTGDGSDFRLFLDHGFHMLMLGVAFNQGASYLHYVESAARVPYREDLMLDRQRRAPDGTVENIRVAYYGRASSDMRDGNKHRAYEENFNAAEDALMEQGVIARRDCAFGHSTYGALADIHAAAMALVQADPYALVTPTDGSA